MRKISNLFITIIIMILVSLISLLVVSACSYTYKWQADKALIGITITYILAGFCGGLFLRLRNKMKTSMGRKMLEAILISSIFMAVLIFLSASILQHPFQISSRFLMIWMLLTGSACLGRIL